MIIGHAIAADLDAILGLEQAGFAPAEQWSGESWVSELAEDGHCVLTHRDADGCLVGVAAFSSVDDMADLNRVVVVPPARGRGIGGALVRAGLEWAQAVGANRMLLEVSTDNLAALGLYRRLGFDEIHCRKDYYGPGRDALVMVRPIEVEEDEWMLV